MRLDIMPLADGAPHHEHAHAALPASAAAHLGPAAGIAVCAATIAAKLGLYVWTARVAAEQRSQVLLANAWHHVRCAHAQEWSAMGTPTSAAPRPAVTR